MTVRSRAAALGGSLLVRYGSAPILPTGVDAVAVIAGPRLASAAAMGAGCALLAAGVRDETDWRR